MTTPNNVIRNRIASCIQTLLAKEGEYARPESRFENFEIAARVKGTTPDEALWGMLAKHLASVIMIQEEMHQILKFRQSGFQVPQIRREAAGEKFTDLINYLLLLKAMGEAYDLFTSGQESNQDNADQQDGAAGEHVLPQHEQTGGNTKNSRRVGNMPGRRLRKKGA